MKNLFIYTNAISFCFSKIIGKYWRLWQERLEEAEDKGFQPLAEKANAIYRLFYLCFSALKPYNM